MGPESTREELLRAVGWERGGEPDAPEPMGMDEALAVLAGGADG